jgi:hypothetical protein
MENKENVSETTTLASAKGDGTYVHKLKKPFEYEGKKYTKIDFYFGKLSGKDAIAVEAELNASGKYIPAQEISIDSICKLAGRAANIGCDVLEALPLSDFNKIIGAARNFLLGAE